MKREKLVTKLLIYMRSNKSEYDIFNHTDYYSLKDRLQKEGYTGYPNYGNKVWYQGIISELYRDDLEYSFYDYSGNVDCVNESYDAVLMPCANIFSEEFVGKLVENTEFIRKLKIPVYVISCGIQLGQDESIDYLVSKIGKESADFIDAVYSTGGDICLRGYISKEFFDKLGFKDAFVGGCPSIYQTGRNLGIIKKTISPDNFKVAVNGHNTELKTKLYRDVFKHYPQSEFFDQDEYGEYLYSPGFMTDRHIKKIIWHVRKNGYLGCNLLFDKKVNMFADVSDWIGYLTENNFSMSFGSRIHGNIVPILAGIPGVVNSCDSRTLEIAQFYNIPCYSSNDLEKFKNLYELYETIDYSSFNLSYKEKYDKFEAFLRKCKLVENINEDNIFGMSSGVKKTIVNEKDIQKMESKYKTFKSLYWMLDKSLNIYHGIK